MNTHIYFTPKEQQLKQKFEELNSHAGTHSPSWYTLARDVPGISVRLDYCFLSNPYATDLFYKYLKKNYLRNNRLREIIEYYPSQNDTIAEYLSEYLQVPTNCVLVGNGATENIQAILHNFSGQKVVINIPTFSPYYEFMPRQVEVIYYALAKHNNFQLDVNKYINFVKLVKPDTIIIISPNNPDGGCLSYDDLHKIVMELHEVKNIIIDDSFSHFISSNPQPEVATSTKLFTNYKNVTVIKSFSKDFGIAGIRVGYALLNEQRVAQLLQRGYLWNSNGLAEFFIKLYTTNKRFQHEYEIVRKKYVCIREGYIRQLEALKGIKIYPSKANFVLFEIVNGMSASDLVAKLLIGYGIYVRNCSDKIGLEGEFVRMAVRRERENRIVLRALTDILN